MLSISLKGLWAHKRRLLGTFLAVFLGVAFLSGTLTLGDTLRANFDNLFATANAGTDAVVRHDTTLGTDPGEPDSQRGFIDPSLVERVRAVDGVAAVAPYVEGFGQLIGKNGEKLGGNGPPTLAGNWIDDPDLNPYHIVEGRAPRAPNEVVINRGAANNGDLRLGDTTTVQVPQPVEVKIVGIANFGSADGLGGVTFTAFTLESAQQLVTKQPGQISSISVKAEPGVSQTELVRRIRSELPNDVQAITSSQLVRESTSDINQQFLDVFRTVLVVFAGVALLVATFSIYNTFSILVAQRTRESALLRAVGAARGQILVSVVLESLLVGVVASAAGLFGGLAIAGLLKGLFDAFGFALPAGGLVFKASTVIISLIVGVVVTFVAGAFPAVKASRVPPLAALRDVAIERTSASITRVVAGLVLSAIGVVVVLAAVTSDAGNVLAFAGLGAILTMIGVVVFGPVVATLASSVLGSPLAKLRGVTGSLARQNAMRNPRRTAGTASALMVGVGVVTLFTVFAASLKTSIDDSVSGSFRGDLVITTGRFGGGGISPQLASDVGRLPEVRTAAGLGTGRALIGGDTDTVTVADPRQLRDVVAPDVASGSLDRLGDRQVAVSKNVADDKGWRVGTTVPTTFADGTTADFTVGAIYDARDVLGDYLLTREAWGPHTVQDIDTTVLIKLKNNVPLATGKAAVEKVDKAYGAPDVEDRQGYLDELTGGVNMLLGIVYVMLALAIVIALMGIGNTLALSIHERTRELGLLRAVGQTRPQIRSMIRWESVIVALFGTVGGLGLGVFLGWALVQAASGAASGPFASVSGFSAPPTQLVVVLVVGAIAGVLAGIRPARRAARLDVLNAIASE